MSAPRAEVGGEVAMGYFGSLETESREVTNAGKWTGSRQTVPKASRMALLGAALWYWQEKGGRHKGVLVASWAGNMGKRRRRRRLSW
jgi:hypothetical protein